MIGLGHLLHFRAGIGYRHEAIANFFLAYLRFHALKEVLLEDVWFERAP